MKHLFRRHVAGLTLAAACGAASAAPVVTLGSSYDLLAGGSVSGLGFFDDLVFDGLSETRTYGAASVGITESQAELGGGQHLISVAIDNFDALVPVAGESAFVRIGGFSDGLDLVGALRLEQVVTRLFDGSGNELATGGESPGADGWSGLWPLGLVAAGFSGVGGNGVERFVVEMRVSEVASVPLPGSATLAGMALLLLASQARRGRPTFPPAA